MKYFAAISHSELKYILKLMKSNYQFSEWEKASRKGAEQTKLEVEKGEIPYNFELE